MLPNSVSVLEGNGVVSSMIELYKLQLLGKSPDTCGQGLVLLKCFITVMQTF